MQYADRMRFTWFFILLTLTTGCSLIHAYGNFNHLNREEREYYLSVADQMTLDQRLEYLNITSARERQVYLKSRGFQPREYADKDKEILQGQGEMGAGAFQQQSLFPLESKETIKEASIPVVTEEVEIIEAEEMQPPPKEEIAQREPPPDLPKIPSVRYKRSGDPVTDVLILLDLYEKGRITQEQFEFEKSQALKAP